MKINRLLNLFIYTSWINTETGEMKETLFWRKPKGDNWYQIAVLD
jgi:hypothetical protein